MIAETTRLTYTLPHLHADCTAHLNHFLGRSKLHFPGFGANKYQHQKAIFLSLKTTPPNKLTMDGGFRDRYIIIHNAIEEMFTNESGVSRKNVTTTSRTPGAPGKQPTNSLFEAAISMGRFVEWHNTDSAIVQIYLP